MRILGQSELADGVGLSRVMRAVYLLASDRVPGDFRVGGRARNGGSGSLLHQLRGCASPKELPWIVQRAPWRFAFVLALAPSCRLDELYILEMRAHQACRRVAEQVHGAQRGEALGYSGEGKALVRALSYEFQEFASCNLPGRGSGQRG